MHIHAYRRKENDPVDRSIEVHFDNTWSWVSGIKLELKRCAASKRMEWSHNNNVSHSNVSLLWFKFTNLTLLLEFPTTEYDAMVKLNTFMHIIGVGNPIQAVDSSSAIWWWHIYESTNITYAKGTKKDEICKGLEVSSQAWAKCP